MCMKRFILLLTVLCTLQISSFAQLPSVSVETLSGEKIDVSTLVDGKTPLVISFWSVTCKPCIQELDAINEALEEWQEEANFKIVAVSTDDTRFAAKARAFTEAHGWDAFTLLFDINSDFKRAMNVNVKPQVFIVSADGKLEWSHTGYTTGSEEEILRQLKKLSPVRKK